VTPFRFRGTFNDQFTANFLESVPVKEFRKISEDLMKLSQKLGGILFTNHSVHCT